MAENIQAELSEQDRKNRELILKGNMWLVVFRLCIPLALYQSMSQLFKILDAKMAAHISSGAVSAVAYLSQINLMISALGGGLAIGASLKISEAFGSGEYQLVKKRVSSLYALCAVFGSIILVSILPFTNAFLRMVNTPEELIAIGSQYFSIELVSMVVTFFNNVYIAVERARGNSKRILYLNIATIAVKLGLTAWFVYYLDGTVTSIAVATLLSQLMLLGIAGKNTCQKDSAFGFSRKAVTFSKTITLPMVRISIPVIIEKMAFSFGKVIINSMSTMYGALTVGALGISNNIGGLTTSVQNGFQEGGAAIISQNLGAGQYKRAIEAFTKILLVNIGIGAVGLILSLAFLDFLAGVFAEGDEPFKELIMHIYRYEALGAVTLGINASVMALLYGYGLTKLTLIINISRVFVFRIPVLWFLQQFTSIGSDSVGIVMMVSNISIGLMSGIIGIYTIHKMKKQKRKGEER